VIVRLRLWWHSLVDGQRPTNIGHSTGRIKLAFQFFDFWRRLTRVPQTIYYFGETGLGPQPKLTAYSSMRSGCFLGPRQTGGRFPFWLEQVLINASASWHLNLGWVR
jgi:hypothetical protein